MLDLVTFRRIVIVSSVLAAMGWPWRAAAPQPSATSGAEGCAAIPDPVAVVNGQKISRADLLQMLESRKATEVLERLIQLKLIQQEMNRRRLVIPEEAVDARIKLLTLPPTGPGPAPPPLLTDPTSGATRRGIRIALAMEMMVKQDMRIPEELPITNLQLERWYNALKETAEIVGRREALPPGVFAQVNGESVTVQEFSDLLWTNSTHDERTSALDVLIRRVLVAQALEKKGVVVADEDLDNELRRLERAYNRSVEYKNLDLDTILHQQGMSKAQLRADPDFTTAVGLRKLIRAELTEEQARRFFKEREFQYSGGQLRVSQIFLSAVDPHTGTPKDAKKLDRVAQQMADIKRQIDNGADFADLARRFSEDRASAAQGGDLGFIPRYGKLVEALSMAIFALNKGQVSPPALTPVGLYIFMVTDVKPGPPTAFESVKADVYEDLINAQSTDWLAKLQKDAQIERAKL